MMKPMNIYRLHFRHLRKIDFNTSKQSTWGPWHATDPVR